MKYSFFIKLIFLIFTFSVNGNAFCQTDTIVFHLTIRKEKITIGGTETKGMTINGTIPGPVLRFKEGDYAVIYVKNEMDVETSIHWHGILLPNFYDGVPYLTTPPVRPGHTFRYEFLIRQSGTYWYHSHSALQEQRGVYGSIVIEPKEEMHRYDRDMVIVISDWTNENPKEVLRTLKRGIEWYSIKKHTVTPLIEVVSRGALKAQLNLWLQRMEGMDISDVYYPFFISNGQPQREYPEFQPGEKIRIRVVNSAASTQFWLTFGVKDPLLIAADGKDVEPIVHPKTFIAIAETYDFIIMVPYSGRMEIRATAQDGTGATSVFIGKGDAMLAPGDLPKPDMITMMKEMDAMNMKMGARAIKINPKKENPEELDKKYGMRMGHDVQSNPAKLRDGSQKSDTAMTGQGHMKHNQMAMNENEMKMDMDMDMKRKPDKMPIQGMDANNQMNKMKMSSEFGYDFLKSTENTSFKRDKPVKNIMLNLTGNMNRYIWSINSVPLSEADSIRIKKGEIVRITLSNLTMMHHPMHLHGHFFRVINKNGEYSPLKHTVNVAPMQKVTIEFEANEYGDWFFHCHVLYHMDAGMARVFSYGTPRDERMKNYPSKILTNASNYYFTWGRWEIASHMTGLNVVTSNIRNQFLLSTEYGWNKNIEAELTYERYLADYFTVFAGINVENKNKNTLDNTEPTAIAGIRYLTPFIFNVDVRIDSKLRPQVRISRELMLLRRLALFGGIEYQADFGWSTRAQEDTKRRFDNELTWNAGLEYFLFKYVNLMGSYDNRFGPGGGLSIWF